MSVYGVAKNEDLNPALLHRDTRPLLARATEALQETGPILLIMLGIGIFLMPFVFNFYLYDILFVLALVVSVFIRRPKINYLFAKPILPGKKNAPKDANGIAYLGYDRFDGTGLYLSNDHLRTHLLVFGTTGSGKTRFLLGLWYQAMLLGSGCLYVDGKGDNSVWWLAFSLARRLDRVDDLLVMNYLTSGASEGRLLSNTNNPFSMGTGEQLRSLIVGLMRDSGGGNGDGMWKGRASAMLGALLKVLVYMRNTGMLELGINTIRKHMTLQQIIKLAYRDDLPAQVAMPLRAYLDELPGFRKEKALAGQIDAKALEQHGYLTMQFTEVMADLTDTYGHITSCRRGQIDWKDVVFNRRLVFCMLPALDRDPDALAGLGRMVVAGIRSALGPALGSDVEGTREEVIEQKPSNSPVPFKIILDEYGYYAVKGFAVVAAQARSLGVSVIFAGQDYPSFEKASKEEAASVMANTGTKLFMKLEDPESTFQKAESRGGEAEITVTAGFENEDGGSYRDQRSARVERRKRVNLRDLVRQGPGQAHILNEDSLSRAQLFYADPFEVEEVRVNRFLEVMPPSHERIEAIRGTYEQLDAIFSGKVREQADLDDDLDDLFDDEEETKPSAPPVDPAVAQLLKDYSLIRREKKESALEAGRTAVALLELRRRLADNELAERLEKASRPIEDKQPVEEGEVESLSSPAAESSEASIADTQQKTDIPLPPARSTVPALSDDEEISGRIEAHAKFESEEFENLLSDIIVTEHVAKIGRPVTAAERDRLSVRRQLESNRMAEDFDANDSIYRSLDLINDRASYPRKPYPRKMPPRVIDSEYNSLARACDLISQKDDGNLK